MQPLSVNSFPARAPDPEGVLSRTQVRLRLERAIDALPADFRAVFILRAIEEMSGAEAAARTRLHRARAMSRKELEKDFGAAVSDVFPFDGARCNRMTDRVLEKIARLQIKRKGGAPAVVSSAGVALHGRLRGPGPACVEAAPRGELSAP